MTGVSSLNQQKYLDVRFTPSLEQTLDVASILDAGAEFILVGEAARNVNVTGVPAQIDDDTFRYSFTGSFEPGEVEIRFIEDSVSDDSGAGLTPSETALTLRQLEAELT